MGNLGQWLACGNACNIPADLLSGSSELMQSWRTQACKILLNTADVLNVDLKEKRYDLSSTRMELKCNGSLLVYDRDSTHQCTEGEL